MNKSSEHYDSWVEEVGKQDISEKLKADFNKIGHLLITHVHQKSIRNIGPEKLEGWVRSRYSANVDERVLQKEFIISNLVGKLVTSKGSNFEISLEDIRIVIELDEKLTTEERHRNEKMAKLRSEVEILREEKRKLKGRREPRASKMKAREAKRKSQELEKIEVIKSKTIVTQDFIYKEWMKHVEEKSTSKSYWYIHEYIARFILKWSRENADGTINLITVEAFLTDYGKGKAEKTMNHYTRVSRYFLEFCENLYKEHS